MSLYHHEGASQAYGNTLYTSSLPSTPVLA